MIYINSLLKQNIILPIFEQIFNINSFYIHLYKSHYYIFQLNNLGNSYILSVQQQNQQHIIRNLIWLKKTIFTNTNKLFKYLNLNKNKDIEFIVNTMFEFDNKINPIDFIKQKIELVSKHINVIDLQYFQQYNIQIDEQGLSILNFYQKLYQILADKKQLNHVQNYVYIYNMYNYSLYLLHKQKIKLDKQLVLKQFGFQTYKKLKNNYISQNLVIIPQNSRPTSYDNKINILSLNKTSDKRKCIIPEQNMMFLLFDYSASNITLLCKLLQYNSKQQNIYQKLYGLLQRSDGQELTTQKKKNIVLKTIYSNSIIKYKQIQFYKSVYDLSQYLYKSYMKNKYIYSYISQKKIVVQNEQRKPNILLNRFIMNLETQINLFILFCLNFISKNKEYKILLYIYDSFLMQFNKKTIYQDFIKLQNLITLSDSFKISISVGKDYKNMKKIVNS